MHDSTGYVIKQLVQEQLAQEEIKSLSKVDTRATHRKVIPLSRAAHQTGYQPIRRGSL